MKPDWDKLAAAFADSDTQLIADVDCTAEGEPLCGELGIQGFPTLKWGDPADLQDYEGARDYDSLKEFADENLKPQCSPQNLELCDEDKKKEIEKYQQMKPEDLLKTITDGEEKLKTIDEEFEAFVEGLQKSYEDYMKQVEDDKEAIKKSGLGLMKAVRAHLAVKGETGKDEL